MPVLSAADVDATFAPPIGVPVVIGNTSAYGRLADGTQALPTADPQFEAVVNGTTLLVSWYRFGLPAVDTAVTADGRSFLVRESGRQDDVYTLLHLAEVTP